MTPNLLTKATGSKQPKTLQEALDMGGVVSNMPEETPNLLRKPTLSQSQAALASSQALADKTFATPLTRIQSGNAGENVDVAKGALKQGARDLSIAGAQNAGPVGKAMLANAPEFAKNIQSFNEVTEPTNLAQAQGAGLTTLGELGAPVGPLAGAKTSPVVGGAIQKAGQAIKGVGKQLYEFLIPRSTREAQLVQAYKANTPMSERLAVAMTGSPTKGPKTLAETAFQEGIKGTESSMGVQATRASKKIWDDVISPKLEASDVQVDMGKFLDDLGNDIVAETPEMSRQKSLLEALDALKEDYADTGTIPLKKLQDFKSGWAEFIPEKSYRGQPIAGAFKDVTAKAADKARQTLYEALGPDAREAYIDYGNLQGLKELGQKAMTGGRLKGGAGSFLSALKDMALTPVATVGGRVIYRTGEGIEFVGEQGAKTLADLEFFKSLMPTQPNSQPELQEPAL